MGLQKGEKLLRTAKAFASAYLWSIEKVRPREQLILMGHCGGTILVYEMAQQLTAMGRRPAGIILSDPEISDDFAPYLHSSGLALKLVQSAWRARAKQLDDFILKNPSPPANCAARSCRVVLSTQLEPTRRSLTTAPHC